MSKKLKLNFEMSITDIVDLNKSFAKAKCLIAYCGKNQNKSSISKESFEDALPSIKNIPIVGRYNSTEDKFGAHDIKIINNEDGIKVVNATIPYGVIPESAKQWFEKQVINGEEKDCLFTDAILWKRQYGYEHLCEIGVIGQSMEIDVSEYTMSSDNYCNINKFQFEALCMIESADPCFENACIQLYAKNDVENNFKLEYSKMLDELKDLHKDVFEKDKKGVSSSMDEKLDILKKYNKTIDDLDFSINELTNDELEQKLESLFVKDEKVECFSTTYREKYKALKELFVDQYEKDSEGNLVKETCYYLRDFDNEYVIYDEDIWTKDGYESHIYRRGYSFNEQDNSYTLTGTPEEMFMTLLTSTEKEQVESQKEKFESLVDIESQFENYKKEYPKEEFDNLRQFELNTKKKDKEQKQNTIFEKYTSVIGKTKEFKELLKNKDNYELKDLDKECMYIVGLYSFKPQNQEPNLQRFSAINDMDDTVDDYDGWLKKH